MVSLKSRNPKTVSAFFITLKIVVKRYIATITELPETGQVRVLVIDVKHSKVVYDLTCTKELGETTQQMLITQYGDEISFVHSEGVQPPKPDHPRD